MKLLGSKPVKVSTSLPTPAQLPLETVDDNSRAADEARKLSGSRATSPQLDLKAFSPRSTNAGFVRVLDGISQMTGKAGRSEADITFDGRTVRINGTPASPNQLKGLATALDGWLKHNQANTFDREALTKSGALRIDPKTGNEVGRDGKLFDPGSKVDLVDYRAVKQFAAQTRGGWSPGK